MLFMLPFFFFVLVFTKPNSPLMVPTLTLFPATTVDDSGDCGRGS